MARHTTGYLFKRGANFYCRWTFNGKIFSKALRDDNGGGITNRRQAEEVQAKIMAHFGVADEATALESIAGNPSAPSPCVKAARTYPNFLLQLT
jgi:hypothetical protein